MLRNIVKQKRYLSVQAKSVDKSVEYRPSEQLTLPCQGSSMAIKEDSEDEEMIVEPVCLIHLTNFGEDENYIGLRRLCQHNFRHAKALSIIPA